MIDLLNPNQRTHLPVRWSRHKGFYVENLFNVECESIEDLFSILDEGLNIYFCSKRRYEHIKTGLLMIKRFNFKQIDQSVGFAMPDSVSFKRYLSSHRLTSELRLKLLGQLHQLIVKLCNGLITNIAMATPMTNHVSDEPEDASTRTKSNCAD